MNKIIDPHLHLFNLEEGNYYWLKPDSEPLWPDKEQIAQDFGESDLLLNQNLELTGYVHIEAGFDNVRPWREIKWLEETCTLPIRTVANIDLRLPSKQFNRQLQQIKQYSSVVGVRHILDESSESLLKDKKVMHNLYELAEQQLHFELQIDFTGTAIIHQLCILLDDGLKNKLNVIINHVGFPPSIHDKQQLYKWYESLTLLSKFPSCAIKCSGWEMIDRNYNSHQIKDVLIWCIEQFGIDRVMLASNFPVCTLSKSYNEYWQDMISLLHSEHYSEQTIKALCCQNAFDWYRFSTFP